jgi:hypothetical protein
LQSDERGGQRSDFVSFQTSSFPSSYRRAGNGHSACLQATPPQTEEAVQKFLWKKNSLEKRDSQMRRQGRKSTAGNGSIKGTGVGTTTFRIISKCDRLWITNVF